MENLNDAFNISSRYENVTCSCLDGCMSELECQKQVKNAITIEKHALIQTPCNRDELEFRGAVSLICQGGSCPSIALELVGYNVTTDETYGLEFGKFGSTVFGIPVLAFYNECVPKDLCYAFKLVPSDNTTSYA